LALLLSFSSISQANDDTPLMIPGVVYNFKSAFVSGGLVRGYYTTSKIKKGEVRAPFHREGKFTVITRLCDSGDIVVLERNLDRYRVVCPN
jgi:hypothetical protein